MGMMLHFKPYIVFLSGAAYQLVLYQRSEGSSMTEDSAMQPTGDRVTLIGLNSLKHEGQALGSKSSEVASP